MMECVENNKLFHWVEPFVGGGNSIEKVPTWMVRIGSDCNEHLIEALIGIRDRPNDLPKECSGACYKFIKDFPPRWDTSWLRFVASFGGRFDNGYARQGDDSYYRNSNVMEGWNNAQKQSPLLQGVHLYCVDYQNLVIPSKSLVYCDPPYKGTTKYRGTEPFDHDKFWDWCRKQKALGHFIFVSEAEAPSDFTCIWEKEIKVSINNNQFSGQHKKRYERLFTLI